MSKGPGRVGTRVGRIRDWLGRQTDSWVGRLSFLWFKRYMQASKNSGAATTAYFMLSVVPTALVAIALFGQAGGDANALAERLDHAHASHRRHGRDRASDLRHDRQQRARGDRCGGHQLPLLGYRDRSALPRRLHASVAGRDRPGERPGAVHDLVLRHLRPPRGHVRWRRRRRRPPAARSSSPSGSASSIVYWLWTPRFLLHKKVPTRRLLPGAVLGAFVLGGTIGTAPLWMGPTLNQNAQAFGPFGVVLAMLGFVLIVITISMVCAVFAPVWEEFRAAGEGAEGRASEGAGYRGDSGRVGKWSLDGRYLATPTYSWSPRTVECPRFRGHLSAWSALSGPCRNAESATCPAARGRAPAETKPGSPRASSRCCASCRRAPQRGDSPSGSSSPRTPSTTTSRRPCSRSPARSR